MEVYDGIQLGGNRTIYFELWLPDASARATGLTFAAADTKLSKDGAAFANSTNLPAEIGTLGIFSLVLQGSAGESTFEEAVVSFVDAPTKAWLDKAILLRTKSHHAAFDPRDVLRRATAQAGGASTITLDTSAVATDDWYNGSLCRVVSGTGSGQSRNILDYVGTTKVATVDVAWVTQPDVTSVFEIIDTPPAPPEVSSDLLKIGGSATALTAFKRGAESVIVFACTGTPTASSIPTDLTETTTDHYVGSAGQPSSIRFVTGVLAGQVRRIDAYNGTTKVLTPDAAFTDAPTAGDIGIVI